VRKLHLLSFLDVFKPLSMNNIVFSKLSAINVAFATGVVNPLFLKLDTTIKFKSECSDDVFGKIPRKDMMLPHGSLQLIQVFVRRVNLTMWELSKTSI
ncbi:hypothetical protein Tco_1180646, partial [Tanacetum coccineum]